MKTLIYRRTAVLFCFATVACSSLAIQNSEITGKAKNPPQAGGVRSGTLTGFVFAINNEGDLKPGRLAHVIALFMCKNGLRENEDFPKSVAWQYRLDSITATDKMANAATTRLRNKNDDTSEAEVCRIDMRSYKEALATTLDWAKEQNKLRQVREVDADEEGHFTISALPPGEYTVIALGRAGTSQVFWETDRDVVVNQGKTTAVKLSGIKQACLVQ